MANVSRASNRKDSTPRWCGRPTALRDFEPRDGSYGSSSAHAVKATRPCLSVLPPKATFTNQDVIRRFVQEPIQHRSKLHHHSTTSSATSRNSRLIVSPK